MAKDIAAAINSDGSLDAASIDMLAKALASADKGSFTYLEFRKAVESLVEKGLSEKDARESVFTTAETLGTSRTQLVKSAHAYLKTLDAEQRKVAEALERKLTAGMEADRARVTKTDAQLAKLQQQRVDLEAKIAELEQHKLDLEKQLLTASERATERGAVFERTYSAVRSRIAADLEDMRAHG